MERVRDRERLTRCLVKKFCFPMQQTKETEVLSLDWEDLLEKAMETLSSIPVWNISWKEDPGRLEPMGLQS